MPPTTTIGNTRAGVILATEVTRAVTLDVEGIKVVIPATEVTKAVILATEATKAVTLAMAETKEAIRGTRLFDEQNAYIATAS